jgi:hypothetical protein
VEMKPTETISVTRIWSTRGWTAGTHSLPTWSSDWADKWQACAPVQQQRENEQDVCQMHNYCVDQRETQNAWTDFEQDTTGQGASPTPSDSAAHAGVSVLVRRRVGHRYRSAGGTNITSGWRHDSHEYIRRTRTYTRWSNDGGKNRTRIHRIWEGTQKSIAIHCARALRNTIVGNMQICTMTEIICVMTKSMATMYETTILILWFSSNVCTVCRGQDANWLCLSYCCCFWTNTITCRSCVCQSDWNKCIHHGVSKNNHWTY